MLQTGVAQLQTERLPFLVLQTERLRFTKHSVGYCRLVLQSCRLSAFLSPCYSCSDLSGQLVAWIGEGEGRGICMHAICNQGACMCILACMRGDMEASSSWVKAFNQLTKRARERLFLYFLLPLECQKHVERKGKRYKNAVHYIF